MIGYEKVQNHYLKNEYNVCHGMIITLVMNTPFIPPINSLLSPTT